MEPLQIGHQSYKLLITGMSGFGKTTYWLRALLGTPARCRFVFDHKGEVAVRLGCTPAFTLDELAAAVPSGWCVFNPSVMFKGRMPDAFLFFCEFSFEASCRLPGRKVFGCDELQQFVGTSQVPQELAMVCDDGRIRGLDMLFISSAPNLIHNRLRGQVTEAVAFCTQEQNPLDWLEEKGFDREQVRALRRGEFLCRNLLNGYQVGGRMF